ncbi:hypothetical protein ACFU5O_16425 [Streptomyces sp. NPDC057445]|uniref:hypothetical protein n=1 Tax=Streptomyces sp. NPDC057445 TaxID=3346136 RepID=UPI0036C60178
MLSTVLTRAAAALLAAGLLAGGCATNSPSPPDQGPPPAQQARGLNSPNGQEADLRAPVGPARIPGLGPDTHDLIPDDTYQAVVVTGYGPDSSHSTVTLYERDPSKGWGAVSGAWRAHNGRNGWTDEHWAGDGRSPNGVFGLTDAGGRLPDPGTRLPYHETSLFTATGRGVLGEPLEGSFDYVVAINYNRRAGGSPLYSDYSRPLGWDRGGGVWFHVDHEGPTQACVSLTRDRMRQLLRWLDPEQEPVVVMGDAESLER